MSAAKRRGPLDAVRLASVAGLLVLGLLVLGLLVWGPSAHAQGADTPGPDRIAPPKVLLPQNPPESYRIDSPQADRDTDAIRVTDLDRPNPDGVGLPPDANAEVGQDLWRELSADRVHEFLTAAPADWNTLSLHAAQRALLRAAATPPDYIEGGIAPGRLFELRVRKLLDMGLFEDVDALTAAVPQDSLPEASAINRAEALFLLGETETACAETRRGLRRAADRFWQRANVFCQLDAGQTAEAQLGLSILREEGEDDALFFRLTRILTGEDTLSLPNLSGARPLHVAMLKASGSRVPEDSLKGRAPWLWRAVAETETAPPEIRLPAAEQAVNHFALPVAALRAIYRDEPFTPETRTEPLSFAEENANDPRTRALLFQAATEADLPTARAEIIGTAFRLARQNGGHLPEVTGRVFAPELAALEPSVEIGWLAEFAVVALLHAREETAARRWFDFAGRYRGASPETRRGFLVARPLFLLMDREARLAGSAIQAVDAWTAIPDPASGATSPRTEARSRLLVLFQGLGWNIPDQAFPRSQPGDGLRSGPLTASPAYLRDWSDAGRGGRTGEAILLTLNGLAPDLPRTGHVNIVEGLQALRLAGLDALAERIALDAALRLTP